MTSRRDKIHPNWWGMPPAILTGWVDRVIRPGLAYEFLEGDCGEGVPRGLLQARRAIVFNTSNTFPIGSKTILAIHCRRFGGIVAHLQAKIAGWLWEAQNDFPFIHIREELYLLDIGSMGFGFY